MKLQLAVGQLIQQEVDAWILGLYEGTEAKPESNCPAEKAMVAVLKEKDFTGKLYETAVVYPVEANAKKMILVGMGKSAEITTEKLRGVAGTGVKVALKLNVTTAAMLLRGYDVLCPKMAAQAMVEGAILASYNYDGLKSKPKEIKLTDITLVSYEAEAAKAEAGVKKGLAMSAGTNLARTLTAMPANQLTPSDLALKAVRVAAANGLEISVLDQEDMEELHMGCLLGVAQGSIEPPKMIVMKHMGNPGGDIFALVGKGITFDSGGISLKPSAGMENMKGDMAGAAAVLGAMEIIGKLKPHANIIAVIAATENMPDGGALKPGDVIKGMTGKSVEIISTDAEGRLILADAVAYAEKLGAKKIVDSATLTGACARAFGGVYAGYIATCEDLSQELQAAAELTGERYWRMPIHQEYKDMYKSAVADINNSGGAGGGMQIGGMIIAEFVDKAAYVHLDIAGTSATQADKPYLSKGFTGMSTRTMAEMALAQAKVD
jgi:leucyl aminopeptidase